MDGVGLVHAEEYVDCRGFPGTVGAEEAVDVAFADSEGEVV